MFTNTLCTETAATVSKLGQQRRILDENKRVFEGKDKENTQASSPGFNTTWTSNTGVPQPLAGSNTFATTAPAQVLTDNVIVKPVFSTQSTAGYDSKDANPGQQLVSRNARANNISNASPEELQRQLQRAAQVSDPFGAPPMPGQIDTIKQAPRIEKPGIFSGAVRVESRKREVAPAAPSDPFFSPPPAAPGVRPAPAAALSLPDAPPSPEAIQRAQSAETSSNLDTETAETSAAISALRPTGRRSLRVEPPAEGAEWHFSKLKDHAILELRLRRAWTPLQITQSILLALGLLAFLLLARAQKARQP